MDTLQLLSQSLRGIIVAPPGKLLFVADYASIEARVLLWCARDEAGLDLFRKGLDMYCDMASSIYKREIIPNEDNQPPERALGKVAILGLGYQMGAANFVDTAYVMAKIVIPEDVYCVHCGKGSAQHRREDHVFECEDPEQMTAVKVVNAYREKYHRVKQLWYDQETAAGEATYDKEGTVHKCFPCSWVKEGRFLYCVLPSGRRLAYPDPQIKTVSTSWGAKKAALTYMGVNATTRKWMRQTSYGGLLVENIVQAISRDIMAEAMKRCEESRIYSPILSVHDELIAEAHKNHGSVKEFVALVGQTPAWAPGCPVAAAGWAGPRYRK